MAVTKSLSTEGLHMTEPLTGPLTPPIAPAEVNPQPHRTLAGNHADDDGQAIDDWFEAAPAGPVKYDDAPRPTAPEVKPVATRLLTRTVTVGMPGTTLYDPVQLFPADTRRKSLVIQVADSDPTDVLTTVASPAAGADWAYTVPVGQSLKLSAVRARLITDITAASRFPVLQVTDASGNIVFESITTTAQPASTTKDYSWANVGERDTSTTYSPAALVFPDLIIPAGYIIDMDTLNIQAGDQWSAITVTGQTITDTTVRIASDKASCYGGAEFSDEWKSDYHTGEVWVYAPNATDAVVINGWTVTE